MSKPRIGITCSYRIDRSPLGAKTPRFLLDARFCDLVRQCGGRPIIIPASETEDELLDVLEDLDAVILSGGPDVPSEQYGAEPHPATSPMLPRRVTSDFRVLAFADECKLPLLAICGGHQELNVHRGGTLHQHLPDLRVEPVVIHRHDNNHDFTHHPVRVSEGSLLHRIVGVSPLPVNSSHHQGVAELGRGLLATARADDGLVEAIEDPSHPFCLGIQWHPEDMPDDPVQRRLFAALVAAARNQPV